MKDKIKEIIKVQSDTNIDDERKWCVYIHTSPSGKRYVGITSKKPERRWGSDGNGYLNKNPDGTYKQPIMANAVLKYPWNMWDHEVVVNNITESQAKQIEKELIQYYQTNNSKFGYNATDGGDGMSGFHHSPEAKKKMSEAKKGKYTGENSPSYGRHWTEESKQKLREANLGRPVSKDTRQKLSEAGKGRQVKEETRQKLREARTGMKMSKESIEKMRETLKGKFIGEKNPNYGKRASEKTRQKIREARLGTTQSEDTKRKISNALTGKKKDKTTRKKMSEAQSGYRNKGSKPVYSKELDMIFWGAKRAVEELSIKYSHISKCCKDQNKTCGKHPDTNEPLHWLYVYDQTLKGGTIVQGALTLGYVTQQQVDEYLNSLKQKGND